MMVIVFLVLLAAMSVAMTMIEDALYDEFSTPAWLHFDEPPTPREKLELENEEYDWGHNIKNYMEE